MYARRLIPALLLLGLSMPATATAAPRLLPAAPTVAFAGAPRDHTALGSTIVLSWNDLGMHCMNKVHATFSVLPPYNNLFAQVVRRGDAVTPPQLLGAGVTVEYSIPGNTYSVGKTDFWTYAPALFGVTLPANVGLTGKGLTGTLDPGASVFSAHGIPVTPWPDADLVNEHPFQQALVIARAAGGGELARSTPVIPVSTELNCVSAGCHASEDAIVRSHEQVAGYDPNARPILCASCHASPALGTAGIPAAKYFSFRIHDQHRFLDESMSGVAECYKCHPGSSAQCLRGAMSTLHGLQCQDCHGTMGAMANGIDAGRIPWLQEPRCATCHLSQYAENPGTLFKNSFGHGGIMCEGCHNSTHADTPARDPEDNANSIALQGHAGSIGDCTVCHGVSPAGAGPHGNVVTDVPGEILAGAAALRAFPNPTSGACAFDLPARGAAGGRLIVYDLGGRIVRLLEAGAGASRLAWDGVDAHGARVRPGTYFARWQEGGRRAAVRLTVVR